MASRAEEGPERIGVRRRRSRARVSGSAKRAPPLVEESDDDTGALLRETEEPERSDDRLPGSPSEEASFHGAAADLSDTDPTLRAERALEAFGGVRRSDSSSGGAGGDEGGSGFYIDPDEDPADRLEEEEAKREMRRSAAVYRLLTSIGNCLLAKAHLERRMADIPEDARLSWQVKMQILDVLLGKNLEATLKRIQRMTEEEIEEHRQRLEQNLHMVLQEEDVSALAGGVQIGIAEVVAWVMKHDGVKGPLKRDIRILLSLREFASRWFSHVPELARIPMAVSSHILSTYFSPAERGTRLSQIVDYAGRKLVADTE